jgi:hypothetical protein
MPIQVYSVQVRGRDIGGNHRCANKEEAQGLYDTLSKAVNSPEEFFEIKLGDTVATARKSNIAGFSMSVHMEQTQEEIKAQQIAQIEQGYGNNLAYPSGQCSEKAIGGYIGGGLFNG